MADLKSVIHELAIANRILAAERVVDAFGHVSVRHPEDPSRYLLSRSRSPELVEPGDIMEFTLKGEPLDQHGRAIYAERGKRNAKGNLAYFSRNSQAVQTGVANRFRNELKDALAMLAKEV